jgi:predicted  nucleic acid-binding Zn-ribbon protein
VRVSRHADLLELHDVDLLLRMVADESARARMRRLGFRFHDPERVVRRRERLAGRIDPRWIGPYERAQGRYGRGLVAVRERVCQGCFITLPTSATPDAADTLTLCESCGRVLYWR